MMCFAVETAPAKSILSEYAVECPLPDLHQRLGSVWTTVNTWESTSPDKRDVPGAGNPSERSANCYRRPEEVSMRLKQTMSASSV